jgi:hypothetical protein
VRRRGRGDDLDRLEHRVAHVLQQPLARAEDDRDDVQVQLVEVARGEELLHRACAARDRDVPAAGRRPRLLQRGVDPVGDEREGGAALHGQGSRAWCVRTNTGAW